MLQISVGTKDFRDKCGSGKLTVHYILYYNKTKKSSSHFGCFNAEIPKSWLTGLTEKILHGEEVNPHPCERIAN